MFFEFIFSSAAARVALPHPARHDGPPPRLHLLLDKSVCVFIMGMYRVITVFIIMYYHVIGVTPTAPAYIVSSVCTVWTLYNCTQLLLLLGNRYCGWVTFVTCG